MDDSVRHVYVSWRRDDRIIWTALGARRRHGV